MLIDYKIELAKYRKLGEQAMAQLSDESLNLIPGPEANSIAMIVRHLHGNLCSRFTDFLTTDGEKPDRDRAQEFGVEVYSRPEVDQYWTEGWSVLEATLAELTDEDLSKDVIIKGKGMTADAALCRALAHVAYHMGQIVMLGRMARGDQWNYLSTPR